MHLVLAACGHGMKPIGISDFSKQKPKPRHHRKQPGSPRGLGAGTREPELLLDWPKDATEWSVEDTGAGLAALLGAFTSGAGRTSGGALLSLFFSFPLLELLGSGCPVCEKTCRMIIKLFISLYCSFVSFLQHHCATMHCISQPFVLGRCL